MIRQIAGRLALTAAAALAVHAGAEPRRPPPATYPAVPLTAASAEGFAPSGWAVESRQEGDLNADGRPDLALVLRGQDRSLVLPNLMGVGEAQIDTNPRVIVVAFAQPAGGYRLAMSNRRLIPRMDDPNLADYLEGGGLTVEGGALHLRLTLWYSAGSWETSNYVFTFRYQAPPTRRGRRAAATPGRFMLISCTGWYLLLLLYSHLTHPAAGIPVLMVAGFVQSLSQVTMAALLLRSAAPEFRGRVMGIRMLAIYGLPIGLLMSGPLIGRWGYPVTATLYCVIGLAFTLFIAVHWRRHLWRREAPANRW